MKPEVIESPQNRAEAFPAVSHHAMSNLRFHIGFGNVSVKFVKDGRVLETVGQIIDVVDYDRLVLQDREIRFLGEGEAIRTVRDASGYPIYQNALVDGNAPLSDTESVKSLRRQSFGNE